LTHDYLKKSIETQAGRASAALVMTLMGGVLVLNSFLAEYLFAQPEDQSGTLNPYSTALAFVGAVLLGAPIIKHAIVHPWRGTSHMDELVALALLAAIAISKYRGGGGHRFFVVIGNLIETRTALGARASIESLIRLTPAQASRQTGGGAEEQVDVADLRPGDTVRGRPGDNVPPDSEVISGETTINQANITGESMPVEKRPGDEVFSGTSNLAGAIGRNQEHRKISFIAALHGPADYVSGYVPNILKPNLLKLALQLATVKAMMIYAGNRLGGMKDARLRVQVGNAQRPLRQQHFMEGSQYTIRVGDVMQSHASDDQVIAIWGNAVALQVEVDGPHVFDATGGELLS
jgi:hypothetical protein